MSWSTAVSRLNAACIEHLGGEPVYWIPVGPEAPFTVTLIVDHGTPVEGAAQDPAHRVVSGELVNFETEPRPGDAFRLSDDTEYTVHAVNNDGQGWVEIAAQRKD
jgi:hypothetical protein